MKFHEDDRAQRLLDIFPTSVKQVNVTYVNSTNHIVAWHRHNLQTDFWCCLKGSFKVGIATLNGDVEFKYLSDKKFQVLRINPPNWHGYKALEPNSILLYGLTEKWSLEDEYKLLPGCFGESWETENC